MVKNLLASAEDTGLVSELGRCPGEGNGYPLQCSCLENSVDLRSNQSILKEISPGICLEGIMLKLKLQYFGHVT